MIQETNSGLNWLLITTSFISSNIGWFVLAFFLYICRHSLSNLLNRLTSFTFANGDSQVGLSAAPPVEETLSNSPIEETAKNDPNVQEQIEDEPQNENSNDWFEKVYNALEQGEIETASKAFKNHELDEQDSNKLYMDKSIFLRLLFHKANDRTAIPKLKKHLDTAETEEQKYDALMWLSSCFRDSKQFDNDIELWSNELTTFDSIKIDTDVTIRLAEAYRFTNELKQAKKILVQKLTTIEDSIQKSKIYSELAVAEKEAGNAVQASYCRDKAAELDPSDLNELFDAAYQSSEAGLAEIAISNYTLLTKLNPKHSTAWNNLGVQLKEAGLRIKSIDSYSKATELGDTLALANQGYALLGAGFIDEAEKLALKALKHSNVHENVHKLSAQIADKRKQEEEKWKDTLDKSSIMQSRLRTYTEKYYLGSCNNFKGRWLINNNQVEVVQSGNEVEFSWKYPDGDTHKNRTLKGRITGDSFQGKYKSASENKPRQNLLSTLSDFDIDCFGYIEGERLFVFSKDSDRDISVELHR
ncbi:hypothetical protein ABF162_08200 [Vibrio coralliilyticus]|uniref:tetratricopeptide repeat protein n=1 Tax=Vibrio coralliilyticus TaxID=190893 RepID=UPI00345EE6D5